MRSTTHLIAALTAYGEAMDLGAETTQEEINALEEALAALALKVHARNGGYDAVAADGNLCASLECPARDLTHAIGDNVCGFEISRKARDDYDDSMPDESRIYPLDR